MDLKDMYIKLIKPYSIRLAQCYYCAKQVASTKTLPFFKSRPDNDTDQYDCGCRGWG